MVPKLCPGGCFSSTTSTTATCETRDATIRTDPTTTSTRGVDGKKPVVAWSTNNCTLEVQHGISQCRWFQLVFGCKYNLFHLVLHVFEVQISNLLNRSNVKNCFHAVLRNMTLIWDDLGALCCSWSILELALLGSWWTNFPRCSQPAYGLMMFQEPQRKLWSFNHLRFFLKPTSRDLNPGWWHCCPWNPNNLSHAAQPCIECQSPSGQRKASEDWCRRLGHCMCIVDSRYSMIFPIIPASTIISTTTE